MLRPVAVLGAVLAATATGARAEERPETLRLTQDDLRYLPGRDWPTWLAVAPGATPDDRGVGLAGAQSVENAYLLDGLDVTDVVYGDGATLVPDEFLDDLELTWGGFDAGVGRAVGARVALRTRSGTNRLRGSLFAHARTIEAEGEPIDLAVTTIHAERALAHDLDAGIELGGPIVRDRLWFWVGVAPRRREELVARIVGTRVDRRRNDFEYLPCGDGRLCDGDGIPETDPQPGCELLPDPDGPGPLLTACEADGRPDVDPATGFQRYEEIDRTLHRPVATTIPLAARLTGALGPDHQGALALVATRRRERAVGLLGTPRGSWSDREDDVRDLAGAWTSRLLDGRLELAAAAGWHHRADRALPIERALLDVPRVSVRSSNLGAVGRNPDAPESRRVLDFCTEEDPSIRDDFPTIVNCPALGYGFDSLGSFQDRVTDRVTATLSAALRLGAHRVRAGLAAERDRLRDAGGLTGGVSYRLFSSRIVEILRYARVDDDGPDRCGSYAEIPCDQLGEPGDPFTRSTAAARQAFFVEDEWRVHPALVVRAGLRAERQALAAAEELADTTWLGVPLRPDDLVLWGLAPRVAAAWDFTRDGRARARASWSRTIASIPLDLAHRALGGEWIDVHYVDVSACRPWTPDGRGDDYTPRLPVDPRTCVVTPPPPPWPPMEPPEVSVTSRADPDLRPPADDVFTAGVEYALQPDTVVGAAWLGRRLARAVEDVSFDGATHLVLANPGEGEAAEFPLPRREHDALQLTAVRAGAASFVRASYTLARTRGNYPGPYSPSNGQLDPHVSSQYDLIELLANRDGPLPQDRRHAVEIDAWRRLPLGAAGEVALGVRLAASSGQPVEVLGRHPIYGPNEVFVLPRGAGGRTPFVSRLDLRLQYSRPLPGGLRLSLWVDVLNALNRQSVVDVDEQYTLSAVNPIVGGGEEDLVYLKVVGQDGLVTPAVAQRQLDYGNPSARLAPLSVRLGARLEF